MRVTGMIALAGGLLAGCIPAVEGPHESQASPPPLPPRVAEERVTQLPAPPPAWQVRPVTADARAVPFGTYLVRQGDSLRLIAERTGAGSEALARANGLKRPYLIHPGQRLAIPGGRYHLVHAGETGIAISRAYGVPWSNVIALNQLDEPYILRVGQRILVPDAPGSAAAARAATFRLDIDDIMTGGEPALAANQKPARPVATSARALPATAAITAPHTQPAAFVWPVRGALLHRFGPGASGERNDGIKIAAPLGTPIRAAADGVVAYVGSEVPALGGLVIIKHGGNLATVYGHASQLLVQRGQAVKRGQTIALSGKTGFADRPEVHFEIRRGRMPIDPLSRLPAT